MTKLLQKPKNLTQNDIVVKLQFKCQGHMKVKVIMIHVSEKGMIQATMCVSMK